MGSRPTTWIPSTAQSGCAGPRRRAPTGGSTPPASVFDLLLARAEEAGPGQPLFAPWRNRRRALRGACKRAGIAPVSPNDLRRTFATWQAEAGVPEAGAASLLGHSSSTMVRRVYSKVGTDAKRAAMAKLPPLTPADCDVDCDRREPEVGRVGRSGDEEPDPPDQETPQNIASCGEVVVPRDRIELPTRGFSIPVPMWPRPRNRRGKRVVAQRGAADMQRIRRTRRNAGRSA